MCARLTLIGVRNSGSTESLELHKIFCEQEIKSPVQSDTKFLLESRKFAQIDRAPHPPCNESGKIDSENVGHASSASDCGKLSNRGKGEWLQISAAHARDQVPGEGFPFAQGMLSGRRVKLAGLFIRYERTIAQGPHPRPIWHAQHFVNLQTPAFLNTGKAIDRRIRRGAGGPDESFTLDLLTGAELDTIVGNSCHPCVHSNLDSSLGKLLLGVATQLFPEFGQDYIAGMHEHNPQHVSTKIVVKVNCLMNEIVDSGDGLDARKAATSDDEREQWAPHCC